MNTSVIETGTAIAKHVSINEDTLIIDLIDGRTISAPLLWYPRLLHSDPKERNNWRLIGRGEGIHWIDLDEDISVENVLLGKPSGESQSSLMKWLKKRSEHIRQSN
ncbi:DUF2442 domain-containing protein [bacterium]|nr:DUF2442 domain-containing protein [bacterium]